MEPQPEKPQGQPENGAEAGADTAGTDGADNAGEPTQPDQLVDLDEEPVPAANLDLDGQSTKAFPLGGGSRDRHCGAGSPDRHHRVDS